MKNVWIFSSMKKSGLTSFAVLLQLTLQFSMAYINETGVHVNPPPNITCSGTGIILLIKQLSMSPSKTQKIACYNVLNIEYDLMR